MIFLEPSDYGRRALRPVSPDLRRHRRVGPGMTVHVAPFLWGPFAKRVDGIVSELLAAEDPSRPPC